MPNQLDEGVAHRNGKKKYLYHINLLIYRCHCLAINGSNNNYNNQICITLHLSVTRIQGELFPTIKKTLILAYAQLSPPLPYSALPAQLTVIGAQQQSHHRGNEKIISVAKWKLKWKSISRDCCCSRALSLSISLFVSISVSVFCSADSDIVLRSRDEATDTETDADTDTHATLRNKKKKRHARIKNNTKKK